MCSGSEIELNCYFDGKIKILINNNNNKLCKGKKHFNFSVQIADSLAFNCVTGVQF